jgi:hypothetical protein
MIQMMNDEPKRGRDERAVDSYRSVGCMVKQLAAAVGRAYRPACLALRLALAIAYTDT